MRSCKFIIYEKGNELDKIEFETYEFPFDIRIYDLRMEIMWRLFPGDRPYHEEKYYLEMEYIGNKVYKDFGKLFFDKGKIPKTNDSFPLSKFTSEERTYEFVVYRVNKKDLDDYIPVKPLTNDEAKRLNDMFKEIEDKKYIKEDKEDKEEENSNNNYNTNYNNSNSNNYTNYYNKNYNYNYNYGYNKKMQNDDEW